MREMFEIFNMVLDSCWQLALENVSRQEWWMNQSMRWSHHQERKRNYHHQMKKIAVLPLVMAQIFS